MKKMNAPNMIYSTVFDACIGSIRNKIIRQEFFQKKEIFIKADKKYTDLSKPFLLNNFLNYENHVVNQIITRDDIVELYYKFRDNKAAIKYHNEIKNSTNKCLYCNTNLVACLDHYLPKKEFPLLSIVPNNLIPACNDCNFKLNNLYTKSSSLILHPYFEHYPEVFENQWIYARVPLDQPFFTKNSFEAISIEFYTNFEKVNLDKSIKERIKFQFENFILESYISHCAEILTKELNRIRRYKGTGVQLKTVNKNYLLDNMIDHSPNTYHYATYYALANSDAYLEKIQEDFF